MKLAAAHDHLLTAPGQSLRKGRVGKKLVSADDEKSDILHLVNTKSLQVWLCVFLIFQPKKPVDDLAATVFKSV